MAEHPDPAAPTTPAPDLVELKRRLGTKGSDSDEQLTWLLDVATAWVVDRVYPDPDAVAGSRHPEVVEAILLLASRLYARRNTPEGVAGWPEIGLTRVVAEDPDLSSLIERHEDYTKAGLA